MIYLIAIGVGALIGLIGALGGKFFDSLMDYGSLLGEVRFMLALRYAKDKEEISLKLWEAQEIPDYFERLSALNTLYWEVGSFWFTGWICIQCLSARVTTILCLGSIPILLKNDFTIGSIFVVLFVGLSTCNFVIQKT